MFNETPQFFREFKGFDGDGCITSYRVIHALKLFQFDYAVNLL